MKAKNVEVLAENRQKRAFFWLNSGPSVKNASIQKIFFGGNLET